MTRLIPNRSNWNATKTTSVRMWSSSLERIFRSFTIRINFTRRTNLRNFSTRTSSTPELSSLASTSRQGKMATASTRNQDFKYWNAHLLGVNTKMPPS